MKPRNKRPSGHKGNQATDQKVIKFVPQVVDTQVDTQVDTEVQTPPNTETPENVVDTTIHDEISKNDDTPRHMTPQNQIFETTSEKKDEKNSTIEPEIFLPVSKNSKKLIFGNFKIKTQPKSEEIFSPKVQNLTKEEKK